MDELERIEENDPRFIEIFEEEKQKFVASAHLLGEMGESDVKSFVEMDCMDFEKKFVILERAINILAEVEDFKGCSNLRNIISHLYNREAKILEQGQIWKDMRFGLLTAMNATQTNLK